MKTSNSLQLILSITMLFVMSVINAQTTERYRVTGVKMLNNQIVSVSNEVEVKPASTFYIPTAFSPNGDGLNETFGIIGEGITEYNLQIFNRWGELVFESNDVSRQWDGTYRNQKVQTDTYVFKVVAKGTSDNGKYKKTFNQNGTVTVVL